MLSKAFQVAVVWQYSTYFLHYYVELLISKSGINLVYHLCTVATINFAFYILLSLMNNNFFFKLKQEEIFWSWLQIAKQKWDILVATIIIVWIAVWIFWSCVIWDENSSDLRYAKYHIYFLPNPNSCQENLVNPNSAIFTRLTKYFYEK